MEPTIQILHLEDEPADAELVHARLAKAGLSFHTNKVQTRDEFEAILSQGKTEIILADYNLPSYDGMSALRLARERFSDIPFIFVSGTMGEEAAIEALTQGATDYVLKQNLSRLPSAVRRALQEARNRLERRQAKEALQRTNEMLRASEAKYIDLYNNAPDMYMSVNAQNALVTTCNRTLSDMLGFPMEEILNRPVFGLYHPDCLDQGKKVFEEFLRRGEIHDNELQLLKKNGSKLEVSLNARAVRAGDGTILFCRATLRDNTERRYNSMVNASRIHLMRFGADRSLDELLEETVNEAEKITESQIGLYHFVDDDQQSLTLQTWSTRTKAQFCKAEGKGLHYPIAVAGVWVDCVRLRKAVIHNDYKSLPHRKGMPEGHAEVLRELLVPVQRGGKIKAILGVGNKQTDYTENDLEALVSISELVWEITERKQAEDLIRKLYQAVEQSPVSIIITDLEGRIEFANAQFTQMTGYTFSEAQGQNPRILKTGTTSPEEYKQLWQTIRSGGSWQGEFQNRKKDGAVYWELATIAPIKDADNCITHYVSVEEDITERKALIEQLHQSQKMEAVGQLAGGVAHDFNNMLGVIIGRSEMVLAGELIDESLRQNIEQILSAALRSADVIRKLMAFARRQTIAPKILDLNETVEGMLKLLRRLIGEEVELAWMPGTKLWSVKMDPTQIDQILANLCVNARDAIAGVGKIILQTKNIAFDEPFCSEHRNFSPGEFTLLAVSDNGCGIDKMTMEKIFEPFFTTKGVGKGTGLGLATVYGIVKQNSGFIDVLSEPGEGTTFNIYLPRCRDMALQELETEANGPILTGKETILVVEDEIPNLATIKLSLETYGYRVLTASTPGEALRLAREHSDEIDLLLTDLIMPEMNGKDLAIEITSFSPNILCLFMSGYTRDIIADDGVLKEGIHFMEKPFSKHALATKVRELLDKW